ncbi:glycosyltransferase family 2 protein [Methylophilus aquaticus]|uniref:Glycosyltransferase family 2 protein n=1 Tax=Methylophilus aquaticus TaxID=1971610 RepID=A0ABT9JUI0_9PROT|nr:glycosyltransferase family 2 protein [Methylophilus aquaticus]MDP8567760.1 glycosyltransferase family 2 protein [Methylophilus aquaticus]
MKDLSVILVSYNTAELSKKVLDLLFTSNLQRERYEVFVIDNASQDDSNQILEFEFPNITLIKNSVNVGFGRANNQVLNNISGRYVLLLNTDAFVERDTLDKTLQFMDNNPDTGILGVRLVGRDGILQPSCRYFPTAWNLFVQRAGLQRWFKLTKMVDDMHWDHASVRQCDWVPGCYYLVRKEVIDQVGLFDPRFFLYYEEVDHCLAAKKAGWQVTYFPDATVVHIGGESAKTDNKISSVSKQVSFLQIESEILFFRKNNNFSGFLIYVFLFILADLFAFSKTSIKSIVYGRKCKHLFAIPLFIHILIKTSFGIKPIH